MKIKFISKLIFIQKFLTFDECFNKAISCQDYFTNLTDLNTLEFSKTLIMESNVLNVKNGYNMFSKTELNFNSNMVKKGYVPVITISSDTFNGTYVRLDRPIRYPDLFGMYDSMIDLLKGLYLIKYNSNYVNFNCKFSFVDQISYYGSSDNVITSPGIFNITIKIFLQILNDPNSGIFVQTFTNSIKSIKLETKDVTESLLCNYKLKKI